LAWSLGRVQQKRVPVLLDTRQSKNLEQDDDSKKCHLALGERPVLGGAKGGEAERGPLLAQLFAVGLCWMPWPATAQVLAVDKPSVPALLPPFAPEAAPGERARGMVHLSAQFAVNDAQPVRQGLQWRIFEEDLGPDGNHKLVAQSTDATPTLPLPDGNFVVHAALGLAGATKRITVNGTLLNETLVLNAGGLKITGQLGDTPINPAKLSVSIYVPEPVNPEAKLVVANARTGETIGLPEGNYHIVSTLLDLGTNGSPSPTNSVISADLKIQAGKLTDATLRHRAATMTLKLVNSPGSEALANTAFTILTPGGDVIREMIGAFPSATLAEGEYIAIARHDGKTYQATFKVMSAVDRDVEVLAKEAPPPEVP
jgi:hypothetical protein